MRAGPVNQLAPLEAASLTSSTVGMPSSGIRIYRFSVVSPSIDCVRQRSQVRTADGTSVRLHGSLDCVSDVTSSSLNGVFDVASTSLNCVFQVASSGCDLVGESHGCVEIAVSMV